MSILGGVSDFLFGTAGEAPGKAMARQGNINQGYKTEAFGALDPYSSMVDMGGIQSTRDILLGKQLGYAPTNVSSPTLDMTGAQQNVNQFLDPSMQYAMDKSRQQIEATAAGKGGLYSGATGNKVMQNAADYALKDWGNAFDRSQGELNRLNQTRGQQQGLDIDAGNFNTNQYLTDVGLNTSALGVQMEPLDTVTQGKIDVLNTMLGGDTAMNQQRLQAESANTGMFPTLLGIGANALGSYYGAGGGK